MRVVIQRVSEAAVTINSAATVPIGKGLVVFVGIENDDNEEDILWLSKKIVNLRVFDDADKVPNLSVTEAEGDILLISQFTLHAMTKKGNRPSYIRAARPDIAIPIYEKFISQLTYDLGKKISTGVFGADMQVHLINDGPFTIWIDSKMKE